MIFLVNFLFSIKRIKKQVSNHLLSKNNIIIIYFNGPSELVFDLAALNACDGIVNKRAVSPILPSFIFITLPFQLNSPIGEITAAVPVPKASSKVPAS